MYLRQRPAGRLSCGTFIVLLSVVSGLRHAYDMLTQDRMHGPDCLEPPGSLLLDRMMMHRLHTSCLPAFNIVFAGLLRLDDTESTVSDSFDQYLYNNSSVGFILVYCYLCPTDWES